MLARAVCFDSVGPQWGFHLGLFNKTSPRATPLHKSERSAPSCGPEPFARCRVWRELPGLGWSAWVWRWDGTFHSEYISRVEIPGQDFHKRPSNT